MRTRAPRVRFISTLCLLLLFPASQTALAQNVDSTQSKTVVSGLVTVTNKGISTVPSFTLGKPAAILNVSIARNGLAFEPEFRWGLNGRPWSFLFWGRYRMDSDKFHLIVGGHPSLNFKTTTVMVDQMQRDVIVARRFLAGELYPSYSIAKTVSVGAYYLYSHGFEQDVAKNTHFIALRTTFASIPLSARYVARFVPQVYYLKQDARDGFYVNPVLTLGKRDFPLSIGGQINRTIQTDILEGEDFIWNVSLIYSIK